MKRYVARSDGQVTVEPVTGRSHSLRPRLDLANHSPTGFSWGYPGSGPAQLALGLCADALQDDERALAVYQEFKREFLVLLDMNQGFAVSVTAVTAIVEGIERRRDGQAAA